MVVHVAWQRLTTGTEHTKLAIIQISFKIHITYFFRNTSVTLYSYPEKCPLGLLYSKSDTGRKLTNAILIYSNVDYEH
jgi:hypothetical protein